MSLHDEILDRVGDFKRATGYLPYSLYLGRAELECLKAYAETPDFVTGVGGEKSTFCGLTIFLVFDESYLAVGN